MARKNPILDTKTIVVGAGIVGVLYYLHRRASVSTEEGVADAEPEFEPSRQSLVPESEFAPEASYAPDGASYTPVLSPAEDFWDQDQFESLSSFGAIQVAQKNPFVAFTAAPILVPIAIGVSYTANHSIPWALFHGFIAPLYLAYRGVQFVTK